MLRWVLRWFGFCVGLGGVVTCCLCPGVIILGIGHWPLAIGCSLWIVNQVLVRFWTRRTSRLVSGDAVSLLWGGVVWGLCREVRDGLAWVV